MQNTEADINVVGVTHAFCWLLTLLPPERDLVLPYSSASGQVLELQACVGPSLPISSLQQGYKFTVGKHCEKGLKGDGGGGNSKVFWKGGKVNRRGCVFDIWAASSKYGFVNRR